MADIRFNKPTLKRKDMDAVLQTMVNEKIGPGEKKREFLALLRENLKKDVGILFRTYTQSIRTLFAMLNLKPGDKVGISVLAPQIYRFMADEFNLELVLCDVDSETGCISQDEVLRLCDENISLLVLHEPQGQIPYGLDLSMLTVPVLEDISESIFSIYDETKAGSFGSYVICSFEEDGIISTGGGSALLYNDKDIRNRMNEYIRPVRNLEEMPDLNASLGIIQLQETQEQIARRREIFAMYRSSLMKTSHRQFGMNSIDFMPNGYSFCAVLDSRPDDAVKFAAKYSIPVIQTFRDCLGKDLTDDFDRFPYAVPMILRGVSFPIYPFLKKSEIDTIMKVVAHLP